MKKSFLVQITPYYSFSYFTDGLLNNCKQITLHRDTTVSIPSRVQYVQKTESLKTILWWHEQSLLIFPSHSFEFLSLISSKWVFMLPIEGNYTLWVPLQNIVSLAQVRRWSRNPEQVTLPLQGLLWQSSKTPGDYRNGSKGRRWTRWS